MRGAAPILAATAAAVVAILPPRAAGFTVPSRPGADRVFSLSRSRDVSVSATKHGDGTEDRHRPTTTTRAAFVSNALSALSVIASAAPFSSNAEDATDPSPPASTARSIRGCPKPAGGGPNNCVSTASVKQLDNYLPPWTFEVSPDEAFARIKGAIASDPSLTVSEINEEDRYVRLDATRIFEGQDEVEFLVRGDDDVVVFRSAEKEGGSISDFGANRSRIETLRKKTGVFGVMGEGLTADSYASSMGRGRGNGPLGQLKAFYGLQSGEGFQDVFSE